MPFSILVWNVKRFRGTPQRAARIARHIRGHSPDIFAILELRDKSQVRELVSRNFRQYDFGFTDSKVALDILVGYRRGRFDQVVYTQRRDFRVGIATLRPGAYLSIRIARTWYYILFLHTDSGNGSRDYRNRQAMLRKVWSLKRALDRAEGGLGRARFVVLGDLNTMGRRRSGSLRAISAVQEITQLQHSAARAGMRLLTKDYAETWRQSATRNFTSDLDHVMASNRVRFHNLGTDAAGTAAQVLVRGWNQLVNNPARLADFLTNLSDHSSLNVRVR